MTTSGITGVTPVDVENNAAYQATVARTKLKGRPVGLDWTGTLSAAALADNTLYMSLVHIPVKSKISGVQFEQTTQGDTTADNENRLGLYSIDTNLTLLASSADSGTVWEGAAGVISVSFSTAVTVDPGLYYIGGLVNWSAVATAPQIRHLTLPSTNYAALGSEQGIDLGGTIAAQNTLPSAPTLASITATANVPIFLPF